MTAGPTFDEALRAIRRPLRWSLLVGTAVIALAHVVITWAPAGTYPPALVDMVHVDREHNVPTWFSSAAIVILALGFFALLFHERFTRRRRLATIFWLFCGAVALFLSMDETAEIHEALGGVAGSIFSAARPGTLSYYLSGFPSYYWALIYVPIAVPCGIVFGWFAIKEMAGARLLAITGVVLFGFGAVVLDHIEGHYGNPEHAPMLVSLAGQPFRFDIFLVEELCEMMGVFMLIEAVLRQLQRVGREHPFAHGR